MSEIKERKFISNKLYKVKKDFRLEFHPLIFEAKKGDVVKFECPNLGYLDFINLSSNTKLVLSKKEAFKFVDTLPIQFQNKIKELKSKLGGE